MRHFFLCSFYISENSSGSHLTFLFKLPKFCSSSLFKLNSFFLSSLKFYAKQLTSLFSWTHSKKKREREALPQRGQRGRRKLGKTEMESCWMEDRERERHQEGRGEREREQVGNKEVEEEAERERERWRIIGGDELLEQTRLGLCFCCRWQAEQGPHVETITRQTLPDNIIHRLGHVSQTHTDLVHVCALCGCPASLCDFISLRKGWEAKTKRASTQTATKEISDVVSSWKGSWISLLYRASITHTHTNTHTQIPHTISSMLFS